MAVISLYLRMTRHGLNATNSSVYSYHERKRDQKASGYGADRMRLGKDAVKGFDCCSLTLQPTARPVITPQGWIFDKVTIANLSENMLIIPPSIWILNDYESFFYLLTGRII